MPPKTSRRVMSKGVIERLRQRIIAQHNAATRPGGAADREAAPPLLELQPIMASASSTQHSSVASTSTTGRSFPCSIRCKRMKAVRASEKKVDHISGLTPIAYQAKKSKEYGDKALIPNTWVEVNKKNAPDAAAAMTAAVEASISSFEASNPMPSPVEGGSDATPPTPITLPVETQIGIVQREVGVRRGTVIRGLGIGYRRDPQPRGGARKSGPSSEIKELLSTIARMQQEREREVEEMRRFWAEQQRVMKEMQAQVRLLLRGNTFGGESTSNQQP